MLVCTTVCVVCVSCRSQWWAIVHMFVHLFPRLWGKKIVPNGHTFSQEFIESACLILVDSEQLQTSWRNRYIHFSCTDPNNCSLLNRNHQCIKLHVNIIFHLRSYLLSSDNILLLLHRFLTFLSSPVHQASSRLPWINRGKITTKMRTKSYCRLKQRDVWIFTMIRLA